MKQKWITVREHARLTTSDVQDTLDRAQISASAFDWLCQLQAGVSKQGARLVEVEDRRWLRLDGYVGIIHTPCGTDIEILPKHFDEEDSPQSSRALLCKLIASALDLPYRETGSADLQLFRFPLTEWIMRQFLLALDRLLKRGLRFDYQMVEEEQPYLRGQLDMARQMRQPPGREHRFHQRHALFLPDRPENRLLRLALDKVCQHAREADNWRLGHELRVIMHEIPPSRQVRLDFCNWRNDRLLAHYQPVRPWCELILGEHMPLAIQGRSKGISLLFPMERLFEQHVARSLKQQLPPTAHLRSQVASRYLCTHDGDDMFRLKPDLLLEHDGEKWLLDTKWKRLDGGARDNKYDLAQQDFYQMLAYGHKYLNGKGEMVLIYPKTRDFPAPLKPFVFSPELILHVWPYDLESDKLVASAVHSLPLLIPPNGSLALINNGAETTKVDATEGTA
ncbi:McrC family protein [Escherichia coli]|nr:McrC family protein [Escherichia coli]